MTRTHTSFGRRRLLVGPVAVAISAALSGCSALTSSDVDVYVSNGSGRRRTIAVSVTRRDTEEVVFQDEVELSPDSSRNFENVVPIEDRRIRYEVVAVVDGERSQRAFSVGPGTDAKSFRIDIEDEETVILLSRA